MSEKKYSITNKQLNRIRELLVVVDNFYLDTCSRGDLTKLKINALQVRELLNKIKGA